MTLLQEGNKTYEVRNIEDLGDGSFQAEINLGGFWNTCYGKTANLITTPEALPLRAYADDYYSEEVEAATADPMQTVIVTVDFAYEWQKEVTEELAQIWLDAA